MKESKFGKLIRNINLYPPFIGMGVKVVSYNDDFTRFEVALRARWYNRNLFGTHFGGSLFAMSDPFFVFILATNLGNDYIVWDKSASIDFLKPGKGTILGVFEVSRERLEDIRLDVESLGRNTYRFDVDLKDKAGEAVARVHKEVYVRKKSEHRRLQ